MTALFESRSDCYVSRRGHLEVKTHDARPTRLQISYLVAQSGTRDVAFGYGSSEHRLSVVEQGGRPEKDVVPRSW